MMKSLQVSYALIITLVVVATTTTNGFQPIQKTPVVICPGFGNDRVDYYQPLQQPREVGLVAALERRGFDPELIFTLPVERKDWIRVAGGLLDWKFYTNQALPTGNGYGWYLERFRETVDEAYNAVDIEGKEEEGQRVLVIGHSAGGWLARAGMGDGLWCPETQTRTAERICGLVTVGAIHRPPVSVGSCVTRGALAYTDETYPGAFLKEEGVAYVSVGGDAVVGDNTKEDEEEADDKSEADKLYAARGEGKAARVAYTSYEAVCGTGTVTGDGVVPLEWTQLDGSKQLQLQGVVHSINEAGTTIPTDKWYGSEGVIDRWLPTVLEEAGISTETKSGSSGMSFDLAGMLSGVFQAER